MKIKIAFFVRNVRAEEQLCRTRRYQGLLLPPHGNSPRNPSIQSRNIHEQVWHLPKSTVLWCERASCAPPELKTAVCEAGKLYFKE